MYLYYSDWPKNCQIRLSELKDVLTKKTYPLGLIKDGMTKAEKIKWSRDSIYQYAQSWSGKIFHTIKSNLPILLQRHKRKNFKHVSPSIYVLNFMSQSHTYFYVLTLPTSVKSIDSWRGMWMFVVFVYGICCYSWHLMFIFSLR